jgi:trehalose 6-phosphate synthase/phosphatase
MVRRNSQVIDRDQLKNMLQAEGEEHAKVSGKVINVVNHLPFLFTVPMTQQEKKAALERKEQQQKRHQKHDPFHRNTVCLDHHRVWNDSLQQKEQKSNAERLDTGDDDAPISNLARRRSLIPSLGQSDLWDIKPRTGHSAIFAGTESLKEHYDTLLIGGTGQIKSELTDLEVPTEEIPAIQKNSLTQLLRNRHKMHPVYLNSEQASGHYEGYCKQGKYETIP